MNKTQKFEILEDISSKITTIDHIYNCLYLDLETQTPINGEDDKTRQLVLLETLKNQFQTDLRILEITERLKNEADLSDYQKALLRQMSLIYKRATAVPLEHIQKKTELNSQSLIAWKKARSQNDWTIFEPFLEKQVEMSKIEANYHEPKKEIYDVFLDMFEPGMNAVQYDKLFETIKNFLIKIIPKIKQKQSVVHQIKAENLDFKSQKEFSTYLAEKMGYDLNSGKIVETAHPFTINLGARDIRISNRYKADSFEFILSIIHETGHALYEQGNQPQIQNTVLSGGFSYGLHESQSRIWEIFASQNKPFWHKPFQKLQELFPKNFEDISLEKWEKYLRLVESGPIRVEADMVTYGLHIIIRYEIEKELFSGRLQVSEVPKVWKQKYEEYLGVKVENESQGCLQDIHWSDGSFGYFPAYLLGSLMAAQFWAKYTTEKPHWQKDFEAGDYTVFREWLKSNIHQWGAVYTTTEILQRTTGEELNPKYFMEYIEKVYLG